MSGFRVQQNGFQLVLDNNYTVSVQFGVHHYCSNRHFEGRDSIGLFSNNAEVAVIDPDGNFVALSEHDDVLGYQTVAEVIALVNDFNQLETKSIWEEHYPGAEECYCKGCRDSDHLFKAAASDGNSEVGPYYPKD